MKRSFLILFPALVLCISCSSVQFRHPQPKGAVSIAEFPMELRGTYLDSIGDTLQVTANSFYYGSDIYDPLTDSLSSGQTILKEFGELYVINLGESEWEVLLVEARGDNITVYYIILNDNEERIIQEIENIVPVKKIKGIRDSYLIDPSEEQFKLLTEGKLFSEFVRFKKVD